MEQEAQPITGRKNFNSGGFCQASIGKEENFDVTLMGDDGWQGPSIQLGTIEFTGMRQTSAIVHLKHWSAEIEFSNDSEFRDVRARCQAVSSGPLPVCRLSRIKGSANDSREITVHIVFAGEQRHLPGKLHISVHQDVRAQANWTGSPAEFPQRLVDSLSFMTGRGHVVLARFSGLLGNPSELAADQVELLNSEGDTVICRIRRGIASGWLEAIKYVLAETVEKSSVSRQRYWKVPNVRLFGFDEAPVFDPHQQGGELLPLEALTIKGSTFISVWVRYRELLKTMNNESFEKRKQTILSFRVGMPDPEDPSCHRVNIANWEAARGDWGEVKDVPVHVGVNQSMLGDVELRSNATLVEVGRNGDARIRWNGAIPCDQGVIMVAEEFNLNDRRTLDAINRLQQGTSVLPDLMNLLNDPTATPAPRKWSPTLSGSIPYDDAQREAVYKALGNRAIVAIQGPPGTGKTRVIVGIIRQLYRKSRKAVDSDGQAPFRVLISSAQNVAVFNAVDLLANEGILIDQRLSDAARSLAGNATRIVDMHERGRQISQSVRRRLEVEPRLRFQAEQAKAVDHLLRELTVVENSVSVVEALPVALSDFLSAYDSLPVELKSLVERYASRCPVALPSNRGTDEPASSKDRIMPVLDEYMMAEPGAAVSEDVAKWESDFDRLGLSSEFEKLAGIVRNHRRASRDGDQQRIVALCSDFQETVESIRSVLERPTYTPDVEDREGSEREARIVLDELRKCLSDHSEVLSKQKGGLLTQWCQALEEQPGLWRELVEKYAEIRGATCQMAAPARTAERLRIPDGRYDLVVVDEAARTDPGEILIPLTLGERLVLVGDQKQLPPFIDELAARKLQREDASGLDLLREQSFFQELIEALPETNKTMLNRQYRCHPFIGQAISRAFYDGKLESGPSLPADFASWAAKKVPTWGIFENNPLCWVDTDFMAPRHPCYSLNPDESGLAVEILSRLAVSHEVNEKQIGVITFYREQLDHLHARLEHTIPTHARILELNTVDSFQGKEFPLVILLTSRRDPVQGRVGFLKLPNRVNVAVSRAQCQLVIIGSRDTLLHPSNGSDPFKAFVRAAGQNLKIAGPTLEILNL